jgi:membrane associated rhomboid family serine protease
MRCPECSRQRTRARTIGSTVTQPMLTYVLIGICVAISLGTVAGGYSSTGSEVGGSRLFDEAALSRATVGDGELWRLVTAGFLHAGFLHLFFNMYSLYILGGLLEPAIGRLRFALVYFVSMLAGSFGALLLQPTGRTVGASGAIFGLMGAAVIVLRHRGIDPMESGLGIWIGLNLVLTFAIPGISIGGHIGGLAGGALVALVLFELPGRVRLPAPAPALMAAALGGVSVAGAIAVSG